MTAPSTITDEPGTTQAPGADRMFRAMREARLVLHRPAKCMSLRDGLAALADLAPAVYDLSAPLDEYCDGVVCDLERQVADLLGKPDVAFFPTGTMAQQVVLRCWAARTGNWHVALHALSHPETFEQNAFRLVTGLQPMQLTMEPRQILAEEVRQHPEEFGALMLELPLRDAGYQLPTWEELVAVTDAARERGAIVHVDGARLWECTTHFGRQLAEIAAVADTVYVSFYKSLGGLSGAAVAGPRSLIEQARIWRHRYGGRIFQQYPAALSALIGLQRELPQLPRYVAQAKMIAAALAEELAASGVGWFLVSPGVPHINEFHLWLPFAGDVLTEAAIQQAEQTGVALFQTPWWEPGMPPGVSVTDVTVKAPALTWSRDDVRAAMRDFMGRVQS